jgi:hypothetical protein
MVIIRKQDLNKKVNSFIKNNNITELKTDPTQKFQRIVKNTLKQCKNIVHPIKRKHVIQMNPQAPKLKAKIKIHKPEAPIRPVINNTYAPTHKIAKYIHRKLNDLLNLKHEYNVTNTTHFVENIRKLKLNPDHKILTMDIKDLYVNLSINQTLNITNKLLQNNRVDKYTLKEIMSILNMITNQNYFQYDHKYHKPKSGVAMGSPISGTMAEIFQQDSEQNKIKHLLEDVKITRYNRYVDDIFIIHNQTKITPQSLLEQFNTQHKDLQFTINEEVNNQKSYLDLNLTNKQGQLQMEIYRKPTATDITINNSSCHPKEQKLAAYKNWTQRLLTLHPKIY